MSPFEIFILAWFGGGFAAAAVNMYMQEEHEPLLWAIGLTLGSVLGPAMVCIALFGERPSILDAKHDSTPRSRNWTRKFGKKK